MKFLMKNIYLVCLIFLHQAVFASSTDSAEEDPITVKRWNSFVDEIYQLHLKQIETTEFTTRAKSGGYHNLPYFFQQISFYDQHSEKLLSRVEWETRNPDQLHSIEVRVHDNNNRVIREYFASYLPKFRNAPYQTLINLHAYNGELHSFRQFDASDNLIYQVCKNTRTQNRVFEHDDYEIPQQHQLTTEYPEQQRQRYQACFEQLPMTAGTSLVPH